MSQRKTGDHRFPKQNRILRSSDFHRVGSLGVRLKGKYILICILNVKREYSRLGISASRRFGPATERNRFKRLAREAFRQGILSGGYDIVVKPRLFALQATFEEIQNELYTLLSQSGTRTGNSGN